MGKKLAILKCFVDTDVIISALLSTAGASYTLIKTPKIKKIISQNVEEETREVAKRLKIHRQKIKNLLKVIKPIKLNLAKSMLLQKYEKFTIDEKDCHIVAGAHKSKSKFLLTHNIKHYKVDKINNNLGIKVLKPGAFLQYLRNIEVN